MNEIVFFSSPIGLGHATRDIAIAQYLDKNSTKFISGEGGSKLFSEYGFDIEDLYHPPPFAINQGKLQNPLNWLFKYYSYYKKCKTISSNIIEKERPNLIVSDEDFASLTIGQRGKLKTVLITDILETRFVSGVGSLIEKKMNRSMKEIIQKCDLVILPENGPNEGNITRVGPIVRSIIQTRDELRKKFLFNKKIIVVSIGGTNAGKFLIDTVIDVFEKIKLDVELVIISGPSLKIYNDKIRNLGFVNNLHEIIYAADLVISLAGKSTIDESKHYGTPGIFIPIKGHFEQEENAKEVGFSFDDLFRLESLIPEKINEKRIQANFDGAQKAANLIKKLL
ncbi:MAG: UDP-glucuronosyltransferase [Thaumarchaeota archaeon]|nr:UDP-glucuronosyltransferase [Nitrososphaerota archaeon]MBI3640852.1 UDP-glucuronosyltransferase [Nitrososphaerota archaeon]